MKSKFYAEEFKEEDFKQLIKFLNYQAKNIEINSSFYLPISLKYYKKLKRKYDTN